MKFWLPPSLQFQFTVRLVQSQLSYSLHAQWHFSPSLFKVAERKKRDHYREIWTRLLKLIWEQAASPPWCMADALVAAAHNRSTILASWRQRAPACNTPFIGSTRPTTPYGISIESAVFPEFTVVTNWRTDRQTDEKTNKARIPRHRHRHPRRHAYPCEDPREDVGVVECGLYSTGIRTWRLHAYSRSDAA